MLYWCTHSGHLHMCLTSFCLPNHSCCSRTLKKTCRTTRDKALLSPCLRYVRTYIARRSPLLACTTCSTYVHTYCLCISLHTLSVYLCMYAPLLYDSPSWCTYTFTAHSATLGHPEPETNGGGNARCDDKGSPNGSHFWIRHCPHTKQTG